MSQDLTVCVRDIKAALQSQKRTKAAECKYTSMHRRSPGEGLAIVSAGYNVKIEPLNRRTPGEGLAIVSAKEK